MTDEAGIYTAANNLLTVTFDGMAISVYARGGKLRRRIPLAEITDIQFRSARRFVGGSLRIFTQRRLKSPFETITFMRDQQYDFEPLVEAVRQRMRYPSPPPPSY